MNRLVCSSAFRRFRRVGPAEAGTPCSDLTKELVLVLGRSGAWIPERAMDGGRIEGNVVRAVRGLVSVGLCYAHDPDWPTDFRDR
jgi:hypothetical protein